MLSNRKPAFMSELESNLNARCGFFHQSKDPKLRCKPKLNAHKPIKFHHQIKSNLREVKK